MQKSWIDQTEMIFKTKEERNIRKEASGGEGKEEERNKDRDRRSRSKVLYQKKSKSEEAKMFAKAAIRRLWW